MKDLQARPIELDAAMVEYLERVVQSYSLSDMSKAVRCLVNFAREQPDKNDEIFAEVRCLDC
jgi:hypothetical protein